MAFEISFLSNVKICFFDNEFKLFCLCSLFRPFFKQNVLVKFETFCAKHLTCSIKHQVVLSTGQLTEKLFLTNPVVFKLENNVNNSVPYFNCKYVYSDDF